MIATVVGGTGTLGTEIIRQLPKHVDVRVLSRDELKQKELKAKFPHVQCYLGDIRDRRSLRQAFQGADVVFHVAALKHIDVLELNPEQSIKTNIYGTENVLDMAEAYGVNKVIFSSTDKAVLPINVYGMCKGISERLVLKRGGTVYRWGNIVGSRGSAISYFVDSVKNDKPVGLTHEEMSRFWMRIEDAVGFILSTYHTAGARVMIPDMKCAYVKDVINAIAANYGKTPSFQHVGLRPGEKIHENITEEEVSNPLKSTKVYTPTELVELVRPFCT